MNQIIAMGGGNTRSMLALWRAWERGTVLAGVSAGAICWFEYGITDSIPGRLTGLPCLGLLPGSCSPHYDGEAQRRPDFQRMIAAGELPSGLAFDDGAAGHFIDGALARVVSSRPAALGYRVEKKGDGALETPIDTRYLLA